MDLNLLVIFARTAELRSFTAAATSLQIPKSTVSRSIKRLEMELKAPLFLRSTRLVEMTPVGQRLYAACVSELTTLSERMRAVLLDQDQPSRRIRITAVEDLGTSVLPDVIAAFAKRYPLIQFELFLTNSPLNLIREGIDLAIRVGKLTQKSYSKRHLGSISFILVASSRYRDRFPTVTLKDLTNHPLMVLHGYSYKNGKLQFENESHKASTAVTIRATATNTAALLKMVKRDLGIGLLPDFLCREGLADNSLAHICPGWQMPAQNVSLLYAATAPREKVIKELGDSLYDHFRRRLAPL